MADEGDRTAVRLRGVSKRSDDIVAVESHRPRDRGRGVPRFDEIIVTTFTTAGGFQTLQLWIFQNMFRHTSLPIVNVTAAFVVLVMILPVYLAQRLSDVASGGLT